MQIREMRTIKGMNELWVIHVHMIRFYAMGGYLLLRWWKQRQWALLQRSWLCLRLAAAFIGGA